MNGFTVVGYVVVTVAYMVSAVALVSPGDDDTIGGQIFRLAIGFALGCLYVLVLAL